MHLHQPRVAEMVASLLLERILSGDLADGDALPRQEDLLAEFKVSKPSLREALRILEAEGLITVRRGNRGGAIVHVPKAENAAYMIGMVLQYRDVSYADVGEALKRIEPVCVGLVAARPDRESAVLPVLQEIHDRTVEAVDDEVEFTRLSRRFHEELVARCGNETLILIVGALESLWSHQELGWAVHATSTGAFPERAQRRSGLQAHERLLELIAEGDVDQVERKARQHLESAVVHLVGSSMDRVGDFRARFTGSVGLRGVSA